MQLISNCCLGGFYYKSLAKENYKNPFIWCIVKPDDMYTLITNYKNINFNNITIYQSKLTEVLHIPPRGIHDIIYSINIDNKLDIHFSHYFEDQNCKSILYQAPDVFYCNIKNYVLEKYFARLKRFDITDNMIFAICDNKVGYTYTNEDIQKLFSIKNVPIYLFTDKNINSSDNIKVFNKSGYDHHGCAVMLYNYINNIKN